MNPYSLADSNNTKYECTVSSTDWKGKISDNNFYLSYVEMGPSFECVNPQIQTRITRYNVYSINDDAKDEYLGDVEWVEGIGNVTGLLNQLYCVDNSDKVILKKVRSVGDGLIYDAALADVEQIDVNEEKTVVAIFNIRGMQIQDFEPGLNIVRYSDGSVEKMMK